MHVGFNGVDSEKPTTSMEEWKVAGQTPVDLWGVSVAPLVRRRVQEKIDVRAVA